MNDARYVTNLSKGILGQPDSPVMWANITAHIPDAVLTKPGVRILNVASGCCTEAVVLAKRMIELGVPKNRVQASIVLLDKYYEFANIATRKYGFKNVITSDFLTWKTDEKFDVVLGSPPFASEATKRKDTNHRGQGKNIAKAFMLKALSLSTNYVFMIAPYGNRTYSPNIKKKYIANGLFRIEPMEEYYKAMGISSNPCAFMFSKQSRLGFVDLYSDHTLPVPERNIGELFTNQPGQLHRRQYEHELADAGKHTFMVTTSLVKYTNSDELVKRMADKTAGKWRVVFNCTTSTGKFGKMVVVGPNVVLSHSVHCLSVNSEDQANKLKVYLESDIPTAILKQTKINACNSKKFLQYIPLPVDFQ